MSELADRLREELRDQEYREGYDEAFLDHRIATQIRVIREQRGLTQADLAEAAGMKQSRISAMESEDYGSWSVNTLRRLAHALGVRLRVEFAEWGDLLREVESSGREDLQRRAFADDPAFSSTEQRQPDLEMYASATVTYVAMSARKDGDSSARPRLLSLYPSPRFRSQAPVRQVATARTNMIRTGVGGHA